eukprot:1469605-Rhodomonas_salina.2
MLPGESWRRADRRPPTRRPVPRKQSGWSEISRKSRMLALFLTPAPPSRLPSVPTTSRNPEIPEPAHQIKSLNFLK